MNDDQSGNNESEDDQMNDDQSGNNESEDDGINDDQSGDDDNINDDDYSNDGASSEDDMNDVESREFDNMNYAQSRNDESEDDMDDDESKLDGSTRTVFAEGTTPVTLSRIHHELDSIMALIPEHHPISSDTQSLIDDVSTGSDVEVVPSISCPGRYCSQILRLSGLSNRLSCLLDKINSATHPVMKAGYSNWFCAVHKAEENGIISDGLAKGYKEIIDWRVFEEKIKNLIPRLQKVALDMPSSEFQKAVDARRIELRQANQKFTGILT